MSEKSKSLDFVYKTKILDFDTEDKRGKEKRPVIYANAEELVEAALDKRNLEGNYVINYVIKVMADGGQGFF